MLKVWTVTPEMWKMFLADLDLHLCCSQWTDFRLPSFPLKSWFPFNERGKKRLAKIPSHLQRMGEEEWGVLHGLWSQLAGEALERRDCLSWSSHVALFALYHQPWGTGILILKNRARDTMLTWGWLSLFSEKAFCKTLPSLTDASDHVGIICRGPAAPAVAGGGRHRLWWALAGKSWMTLSSQGQLSIAKTGRRQWLEFVAEWIWWIWALLLQARYQPMMPSVRDGGFHISVYCHLVADHNMRFSGDGQSLQLTLFLDKNWNLFERAKRTVSLI